MKIYIKIFSIIIIFGCSSNKEDNDKSVLLLTELVVNSQEGNKDNKLSIVQDRNTLDYRNSSFKPVESNDDLSDCTNVKCKFQFRTDYKQFLELKYFYKREIVYFSDMLGYYYFTYNPKSHKFDIKVRASFKPVKYEKQVFETSIDIESQSGIISAKGGPAKIHWTFLLPALPTLPVIRSGNQLLVCTQDGVVTSLNLNTGKQNWKFFSPGSILIQPITFNNRIIIFDDSGNIFWLDSDTGSLRHKYLLEEMPIPSPILKNNILIVANTRGYLHAIRMGDATSTWRDHSLIGTVETMNDSESGFIVHGNSSALFSYHNGSKQRVLARTIQE